MLGVGIVFCLGKNGYHGHLVELLPRYVGMHHGLVAAGYRIQVGAAAPSPRAAQLNRLTHISWFIFNS